MVITIDGPAGSGKSTLSKEFAKLINYQVLDTGAMFRCVAYLKKEMNLSLDEEELQNAILTIDIVFEQDQIFLNGRDVSLAIRDSEIDVLTSSVISIHPFVRSEMCTLQRKFAEGKNIVAEGRDMGSHVFPSAPLKFYLTANISVRAQRRYQQLQEKNIEKDIKELEQEIIQRDYEDTHREINPLCVPENACVIDTSFLVPQEVLNKMLTLYQQNIDKK